MKSLLTVTQLIVSLFIVSNVIAAQDRYITVNNVRYELNGTYNYTCGETLNIVVWNQDQNQVIAIPGQVESYSHTNHITSTLIQADKIISATTQAPTGIGSITINIYHYFGSGTYSVTLYLNHKPKSPIFTEVPHICKNESSKTFRVDPLDLNFSNIEWQGSNGTLIEGQTTFVGGRNANVTLTDDIGSLKVRSLDACNVASDWSSEIRMGKPEISNGLVNGVPAPGFTYISYNPAQLELVNQRGASSSWVLANGNGSINPNGSFTCQAYANNFVRVIGEVSNSCGTSPSSWTFYINYGSNAYIAYPNPTKGDVTIKFNDPAVGDFLQSLEVKNEKGMLMEHKTFDESERNSSPSLKNAGELYLDLSKFSKGTYFVHLMIDGKIYEHKILKN